MAYQVTKIVYASRPGSPGSVTYSEQILLIFGQEVTNGSLSGTDVLLWRGAKRGEGNHAITATEWGSGSWAVTFVNTNIYGNANASLSPVDTDTSSVSGYVTKDDTITFTYGDQTYTASLSNYVSAGTGDNQYQEPGIQTPTVVDYVPQEVGVDASRESQATASYGTVATYRRAVVLETIEITSFQVQLTGAKQFTATYAGTLKLLDSNTSPASSYTLSLAATKYSGESVTGNATYTKGGSGNLLLPVSLGTATTSSGYKTYPFSGTLVLPDVSNSITYDTAALYKFVLNAALDPNYATATYTDEAGPIEKWTQRKLTTPVISGVSALDGVGAVSWGSVENAGGYRIGLVDTESAEPSSSSSSSSPWSFNEGTSGTTVQGKYARVRAVAVSNQYEYANSDWSVAKLIPDNRTPAGDDPQPTVEMIMTRRIYKAIPYIDVPVEQIGGGGSSKKDVATIEYLEANYVQSSGEIPASQLPFAVYGTTDDDSETTVVNPAYVKGAIDDINQVYAITDIQIASNSSTKFAGVATSVTSAAEDYTLITRKGAYDFARNASNLGTGTVNNARLNKAKAAGGSGNAGIVWVNATAGNDGLVISGTSGEEGLIKVNFATYGTTGATDTHTVVNPSYLESRITALGLGTAAGYAVGTAQGTIPVLGANGKLSIDMMPARVIGGEYLGEVASATAMIGKTNATVGDFVKRTDTGTYWMLGVDGDGAYATADNWFEYAGAVTSVNGAVGAVTQANLGLETTLTATSDTAFPSSKAVATYVTGRGYLTSSSNLNASKLSSGTVDAARLPWSLATWTDGTTHYSTEGDGLVQQTYLKKAFADYGFGDAAKKGVATTVSSSTDLITANAVNTAIGNLDYSDVGAAAASHKHALSDITYSGTTGYSAGTTISSSSTAGQLPTAKAVYDYKPFVNRIIAGTSGTTTFSGVTTNLATTISSENYSIPTAYAVQQALNGKAASSHQQAITTIYATGTTAFAGIVTVFSSYTASSEDYKVPTAYAVKTALDGKAPSTHSHTSSQISDAIAAFTSGANGKGKAVKTLASGSNAGYISADLIPIDGISITIDGAGLLQVDPNYLSEAVASYGYLTQSDARSLYLNRSATGVSKWGAGASYAVGDVVFYQGKLYRCKTATSASTFVYEGDFAAWEEITIYDLIPADRYAGTITGNGSATEFTVTHNLGVKDVEVSLIDNSTDQEVYAAVTLYSTTQVKIGFGAAPASGKVYRVVVRK